MFRTVVDANETVKLLDVSARNSRAAARTLMRTLAIQLQRAAVKRSTGPKSAAAGAYPIPRRTGTHARGFAMELSDRSAVVFNANVYARSLHDGFRPYGNPHARPMPARPYFDDAMEKDLDVDAALAAADKVLGEGA